MGATLAGTCLENFSEQSLVGSHHAVLEEWHHLGALHTRSSGIGCCYSCHVFDWARGERSPVYSTKRLANTFYHPIHPIFNDAFNFLTGFSGGESLF